MTRTMGSMFQELTKLFATTLRIKLIKFFALQEHEWFSPLTVSGAIGSRQQVPSELKALERMGVLVSKRDKHGRVYRFNGEYEQSLLVHDFVISATTPNDHVIAKLFRPLSPYLVIAAGALAAESRGQVDLLVVTKRTKDPRLTKAVKKLESLTAVPVRYLVLEVGEYLARREGFDRVLRDIFDFHHRTIIGRS